MSEVTAPLLCFLCHASILVGAPELGNKQRRSSAVLRNQSLPLFLHINSLM